tara:strand:+ start:521 stop:1393 length:873 start_codon:yes stop_codon:yes gene_type:complete
MKKIHYYIILHITILIWGVTGILGKLINMPSSVIVIDRMLVAFLTLALLMFFKKNKKKVSWKDKWQMLVVGVITAAHWLTFFEALKVSNVSLTLSCLASCSLFVALIEPLFFKTKFKAYELILGLFVIFGIYIIFTFEYEYNLGVILSLISALFAAIFTVWNASLIKQNSAHTIALYEMLGGTIAMLVYFILSGSIELQSIIPQGNDLMYILILGIACTALAFLLGIEVLRMLSPFTVSISVNLEPIYAILLALMIFGDSEIMSIEFYIGFAIILGTIIVNAYLKSNESL